MSKIIDTVVPIPVDTLREVIGKDDIVLNVNLSESKVKPFQALVYLSNLELPVMIYGNEEDRLDALDAYLRLPTLLKCRELETMLLETMMHLKGLVKINYLNEEWLEERREILTKWASLIDSTFIYGLSVFKDDEFQKVMETYPEDTTNDTIGINFVHLFTHPLFPQMFEVIDESLIKNYAHYFNDYMYKGANLFHYWALPDNEIYLMTLAVTNDEFVSDDEFNVLLQAMERESQELEV